MTDDGESCTSSSDSDDQPVKKARFLWEIKGRYHLKKDLNNKYVNTADIEEDVFIPYNAINKWQNQQMAKAVFDNTVNSVIENMGFPVPDFEYIMDGYGNNGNLEDEAVQMAIRSHGLQKTCSCPESHVKYAIPNIPFHRRAQYSSTAAGSSSDPSFMKEERAELEHDFLSEAVAVAIQKKGLGAFTQSDNTR